MRKPNLVQGIADDVIFVPPELLRDDLSVEAQPNPPKRKRWYSGEPVSLYGGYEGLLVRTVLLRSTSFDPKGKLPSISCADDVFNLVRHLGWHDQEHIVVLALNARNDVTAIYEAAIGGRASAGLEVQSVLKVLVLTASAACVLVHNHPSGDEGPSKEDIQMTKALADVLKCSGFTLVDHIIVSHGRFFSFLEHDLPINGR
jgi:DNA repair protein RadC